MMAPTLAIAAGQDVLACLLAASGPVVTARIEAPDGAAERALLRAAVAVAAVRRAPCVRVNAVLAGGTADAVAVECAAAFLAGAAATTGQTMEID